MNPLFLSLIAGAALSANADAEPVAAQREMSTDRPDSTESPITVPAGMVQIEAELAAWGRDDDTRSWTFGEINFKYGVTENVDVQLVIPMWQRIREADSVADGFGDITVRTKINLWGNDGGDTAFGIMPFITLPTGADGITADGVEGGLILPFSMDLPGPFGLGLMTELDAVYDDTRDDYDLVWLNSVVLGIELTEKVGAFFELVSVSSFASGADWEGYGNAGFTWQPIPNRLQFDTGVRLGLNEAAEDLVLFVGCSTRF